MPKHPGKPMGTDTVPAWLTPGEFVMNAESVRLFGPLIEQMNNEGRAIQKAQGGSVPNYYQQGGGINIKPENKGKFTAKAKGKGKGVQEYASQVLANKDAYPPSTVKQANFARNAAQWHESGGFIDSLVSEVLQGQREPASNIGSPAPTWTPPPAQQRVPDPGVVDEIPYDWTNARDLLQAREGYRGETYLDTEGKLTGGHGRLLEGTDYQLGQEIPREVADQWFDEDLATAQSAAAQNFSNFDQLNQRQQDVLTSMAYQLGGEGQAGFKKFREAVEKEDWETARKEAMNSKWVHQTPKRVQDVLSVFRMQGGPIPQGYADGGAIESKISKLHGEGYDAPGQAYAIAKSMGYAEGGGVPPVYAAIGDFISGIFGGGQEPTGNSRQGRRRQVAGGGAEHAAPSAYTGGGRNAPRAPQVDRTVQPLPPTYDPVPDTADVAGTHILNRFDFNQPAAPEAPPALELAAPPFSDENLMAKSSESQLGIAELPVGDPRRVAAIESGEFEPTDEDFDWEEQIYQTDEALRQAQLQAAVTAPDAPGAEFAQARVDALTDQMDSLGVPQQFQGVGADVNVGGPDAPVQLGSVPGLGTAPDDVGAVPFLEQDAPSPQEVIDEGVEAFQPGASEAREAARKPAEKAPIVQEAVQQLDQAATEAGEPPVTTQEVVAAGGTDAIEEAGKSASYESPAALSEARNVLQETFGDLFDGKELARAAVMYLGARATGMSGQRALAWAGQGYINRIDAQQGKYEKAAASGNYTKESLQAYKESGDPVDLLPKGVAPVELGQSKEFYGPKGNRINARQVQVGDNKVWVDKNNKPINLNSVHEDPTRAPGTPEYRARVQDEAKGYGDVFKGLQDRFGKFKGDDGDVYATDLTPDGAGYEAAKFALRNDIPVDVMGNLIDSAYSSARRDSTDGKRVKKLEAYLEEQYVRSQVGDPTLFEGASGEKTSALFRTIARQASTLPGFEGLSQTAISTKVLGVYRPKWAALSDEERKSYNRRAGKGQSGFMVYLQDQL